MGVNTHFFSPCESDRLLSAMEPAETTTGEDFPVLPAASHHPAAL
jgi:hypothetical protein